MYADSEMSCFGRENLRNSAFQRGKTFFIYSFKRNSSAPCVVLFFWLLLCVEHSCCLLMTEELTNSNVLVTEIMDSV